MVEKGSADIGGSRYVRADAKSTHGADFELTLPKDRGESPGERRFRLCEVNLGGDGTRTSMNLRLLGQYVDAESGLHYDWHRHYDPGNRRYTQSDPIGLSGGTRTIAYGFASPLTHADPTERNAAAAIAAALAAARESIERCAKDAACRRRAIYASYKAACGIGCRGSSCEVLTVQTRAAKFRFDLRTMYIAADCDRVIPTTVDHPGAARQAKQAWASCEAKRQRACGCDDSCK